MGRIWRGVAVPQKKPRKSDVARLLDRLAEEERQFLASELLAPVLRGRPVRVRIGGVVCKVRVFPADFEGWGIFQPRSHTEVQLVRTANLGERRRYLDLFPRVRLILCRREPARWLAATASFGDGRFRIEGLVPLELAEEVQVFDVVHSRFDGTTFWFDQVDPRHSPAAAAYLRQALEDLADPAALDRPGLMAEERAAYELNYWERIAPAEAPEPRRGGPPHRRRGRQQEPLEADPVRHRLRQRLSAAGAQLIEYLERSDSYRVTYRIGGRQYTSSVDKGDLTVQVAGICLSGEDRKFDLESLVGVLREAEEGGGVLAVGEDNSGMDEQQYWNIHPPRNPRRR